MNLDNKIALSAYYKGQGLSNADIAFILRVDASSVSRYLKQAEENKWLQHRVQLRLPRELERAIQATVRAVHLEDALFDLFAELATKVQNGATLRRESFVVVRTVTALDGRGLGPAQQRARSRAREVVDLNMASMGIEGGRLLTDILAERGRDQSTVLGVTWGRSTGSVVSHLGEMSLPELPHLLVVALQGGVGRGTPGMSDLQYYPDILAERLAVLFGSREAPIRITLPAYISAATAADVGETGLKAIWKFIDSDESYQQAVSDHERLDVALIGIGGFESGAWALSSGYLPDSASTAALTKEGAVGDIACRFYRARSECPIEGWRESSADAEVIRRTNLRAIGVSLATLRGRVRAGARVLAVAGGSNGAKAKAIHAALVGGLATEIVTDEATAVSMLEIENGS